MRCTISNVPLKVVANRSRIHGGCVRSQAAESMVLLENSAVPHGLPIVSKAGGFVAVLGAGSNDTHLMVNRYTGSTQNAPSFLSGITARAAKDGLAVKYSENDTSIAAGAAAVVVVVRSENEGESHDRAVLTMRAEDSGVLLQLQQLQQAAAAKVQVVVVTVSGGPVDTSEPVAAMGAGGVVTSVVAAWQPGEEGGNALAALLFGDDDFSGALAVTAYKERFTQFVDIANISTVGRGYRYLADKSLQLYPVGYGLSVHSKWATPRLTWAGGQPPEGMRAAALGGVRVVVTIKNVGVKAGSKPVLLFVQRKEGATDSSGVHSANAALIIPTPLIQRLHSCYQELKSRHIPR